MSKPKLWFSRAPSDATLARASRDYLVTVNGTDGYQPADRLVALSAEYDAIMAVSFENFSASVASRLHPRLKIIANHSVGYDHCDIPALTSRGVAVTNTPDVLSRATAETAMLLMLGAARHAVAGDRLVRGGGWVDWACCDPLLGKQVSGARVGIIGMGRIGRAFAEVARGMGMEVHYFNRKELPNGEAWGAIYHARIESLLAVADFLSLHCPATAETADLMNEERFGLLPMGAVFVNTARGALVDEDALLGALKTGRVAAAGLDCFKDEPGGNPAFAELDNVFMLPHLGSSTRETRDAIGSRALDNLDALFAGKTPRDLI